MTDHKTIREALDTAKDYVERYGDSRKDAHYIDQFDEALAALDRIEAKTTAHEDYTEDVDVFKYIREKQGIGHFTHPAIVKLFDMAKSQAVRDDECCDIKDDIFWLRNTEFGVENMHTVHSIIVRLEGIRAAPATKKE